MDWTKFFAGTTLWRWQFLLPGLCIFVTNIWLGATRLHYLARIEQPISHVSATHALGTLARTMMPAGIGEIAYVGLLRRLGVNSLANAVSATITCRLLDIIVGFILLTLSLPLLIQLESRAVVAAWVTIGTITAMAIALIYAAIWSRRLSWLQRSSELILPSRIVDELNTKGKLPASCLVRVLLYSTAIQITLLGTYACLCAVLLPDFRWTAVLCIYFLLWPFTLSPIRGFLDIGSHEGSWVVVLSLLSYDLQTSTSIAIGSHVILFGFKATLAIISMVYMAAITPSRQMVCGFNSVGTAE